MSSKSEIERSTAVGLPPFVITNRALSAAAALRREPSWVLAMEAGIAWSLLKCEQAVEMGNESRIILP